MFAVRDASNEPASHTIIFSAANTLSSVRRCCPRRRWRGDSQDRLSAACARGLPRTITSTLVDGFTFLLIKCSMDMVTRSLQNRLVEGCMVWVPRLREGPSECIKSSAPSGSFLSSGRNCDQLCLAQPGHQLAAPWTLTVSPCATSLAYSKK